MGSGRMEKKEATWVGIGRGGRAGPIELLTWRSDRVKTRAKPSQGCSLDGSNHIGVSPNRF